MRKTEINKKELKDAFFREIPKARAISPMWRAFFEFMYTAHQNADAHAKVLNIFASHDTSGKRETFYREKLFSHCKYYHTDFWENKFFSKEGDESVKAEKKAYVLPYPDNYFDIVINTKIVIEHVSEPEMLFREFQRVTKPGGQLFIPAPLIRRQHQAPHDYFRYTEYGLRYLSEKVGFTVVDVTPTNGFALTATQYAYFLQRSLPMPRFLEKCFDLFHYWIIEPIGFLLDRFDNGYGRDFTLYFLLHLRKDVE